MDDDDDDDKRDSAGPFSPFAARSYEPRFAIDCQGRGVEVIAIALRLHTLSNNVTGWSYEDGAAVFSGYHHGDQRLAVAAMLHDFPGEYSMRDWTPVFRALDLGAAADAILRWLEEEAAYPTRPWFDGGEAQGFRVFHVPCGPQELGPYGYVVFEPKWFEVHK